MQTLSPIISLKCAELGAVRQYVFCGPDAVIPLKMRVQGKNSCFSELFTEFYLNQAKCLLSLADILNARPEKTLTELIFFSIVYIRVVWN